MEPHNGLTSAEMFATEIPAFQSIADVHPRLISELKKLDPARTASTFAGLLTLPGLQANCFRIEWLVHLAIACCDGRSAPTTSFVRRSFEQLGNGFCGRSGRPG